MNPWEIKMNLSQVTTKHYCAGVVWDGNTRMIIQTAPILKGWKGREIDYLQAWCQNNKAKYEVLK